MRSQSSVFRFFRDRAGLQSILIAILVLLTATLPGLSVLAEVEPKSLSENQAEVADFQEDEHPFFEAVRKTPLPELQRLTKKIPSSDPVVDTDPFFFQAQSWSLNPETATSGDLSFRRIGNELEVSLNGYLWNLKAPLNPVLATEDWIFFAGGEGLFLSKFQDLSDTGLFFVSRSALELASKDLSRIPVLFLPLPGNWSETFNLIEIPEAQHLLAYNSSDDAIVITQKDLIQISTVLNFNLSMALVAKALELKGDKKKCLTDDQHFRCLQEELGLLPQAGATAFFGLFYRGPDVEPSLLERIWNSFSRDFLSLSAYAGEELTPEQIENLAKERQLLFERLVHVGAILGSALVIAVFLKYGVFREHFRKQRERRRELYPDFRESFLRRQAREILDVYAHTLLFVHQLGIVLPTDLMEKFLDRFFPRTTAGQKSFVRKFLDNTFYFARRANQGVPVNANTWVQGSLVLGGTDTSLVFFQLKYLMPWSAELLGKFSQFVDQRAAEVYAPGAPTTANYFVNELVRNGQGYMASGAVHFSQDSRGQIQQRAEREVPDEMRAVGLDPNDPKNEAEKKRRIEEKFEREAARRGLPAKEDFIFDLTSVTKSVENFAGVSVPEAKETLLLENRSGLFMPSVKLALKELKKSLETSNSPEEKAEIRKAIELLESAARATKDITGVKEALKGLASAASETNVELRDSRIRESMDRLFTPFEWRLHMAKVREARKIFVKLSYAGDVDPSVEKLPTEWLQGFGEKPTILAARAFRGALTSLYYGVLFTREMIEGGYVLEKDPIDYVHHDSLFARHQLDVILNKAELRYFAITKKNIDILSLSPEEREIWLETYTEEFSRMVGLYRDYDHNPQLEETVKAVTKARMTSLDTNEDYRKFLAGLGPKDRFARESRDYAEAHIQAYIETTVDNQFVAPLSPAQPGMFQKIRQKFRNMPKPLAVTLRAVEALTSEHSYKLGMGSLLSRNVPAYYDITTTMIRYLKQSPSTLTVRFLALRYLWGSTFPFTQWVFWSLLLWTIAAPYQFANRLMTNIGLPPLKSIGYMALFAFIHSMLSWQGSLIQTLFWEDWEKIAWGALAALTAGGVGLLYAKHRLEQQRKPHSREERVEQLSRLEAEIQAQRQLRARIREQLQTAPPGTVEGLVVPQRRSWCGMILSGLKKTGQAIHKSLTDGSARPPF